MKLVEQYVSLNDNYKAVVFEPEAEEVMFEVNVYKWNEQQLDDEGNPIWERIAGPFAIQNLEAAKTLALDQLHLLSGETEDQSIPEDIKNEVLETLGNDEFIFLDIKNYSLSYLPDSQSENFEDFEGQILLAADEFYFVQAKDNCWWSGFLYDEGQIRCWQKFEALNVALINTIKS